ncbi:glycoside hydrolase family 71/99-like protein [Pedosphaera parvula]|uniref:Glycoside hydrolase family 71 n=1 Tax=Pedosphaera parvula (strain Ellin514) TaxID=320771 RepID=B9XHL1_PEDPL|nr:glycoside hydrolase family 71/99-like protein [Pedosphaera parvula]EEF60589.1 hypothetical protein Cflav_PD6179 [Pedosphaera parvula Ellin514]
MKLSRQLAAAFTLLIALHSVVAYAASKPLLVHYRPWFVAKPFTDQWGWHWTMAHFDPDHIDATGQRQIASWYHPLIGPYDSADPNVLEYHLLLIKLAGIDGVIVDWHGADDYLDYGANNERTKALFKEVRRAGLKFALCFEDQVIQGQVAQGRLTTSNAIAHAQQTLLYAETNFFTDPCYLRQAGRPVLLNFGPQYFKGTGQWEQIFSALKATNQPAFFTEDYRVSAGVGGFSWPPMWLSLSPGSRGVLSVSALQNYFDRFEERAGSWPASISSAFPRFHDIYQSAGVRNYIGYLGDRKGRTFRETLSRALTNASTMVQIVTWNDFEEGTMIEPTVEYGFRDLGIVQEQRRQYLDSSFSFGTNDLSIPFRIYQLRTALPTDIKLNAQLDAIIESVFKGELETARRNIDGLEAHYSKRRIEQTR